MATNRLTIYLLRDLNAPDEALDSDSSPNRMNIPAQFGLEGTFFYTTKPPTPPPWASFVGQFVAQMPILRTSSASGLLVLKAHDRYFALTFGYGRSLLDLSKLEAQFGLRVALNRIDASQLRSMDTKTFEDLVVTRTTQTSRSTELPTFGIDISSDILRAVTGQPRDTALAKRLSGSDALVLGATKTPQELSTVLGDLLKAFGEKSYKDNFSWIDHLSLVSDANLVEKLDDRVAEQLASGDSSSTHMAMPEIINWEDIDSFKIGGARRTVFDDLDIDEYLEVLGKSRSELTARVLKARRVSVGFGRSPDDFDGKWSLYKCLISEQRIGKNLYILVEGRWFNVSNSLATDVDTFVSSLPTCSAPLEDSLVGEKEPTYNERMARELADDLLLLDSRIKVPGGASTGIEICDLLTATGEFIHIKRKSRSATLSHLFAQGSVSATTFLNDGSFRDQIREEIKQRAMKNKSKWLDLIPASNETVERSRYTVSYAIIANTQRAGMDWLPFFSKLNLMQQGKQIRSLGFGLAVSRIPILAK